MRVQRGLERLSAAEEEELTPKRPATARRGEQAASVGRPSRHELERGTGGLGGSGGSAAPRGVRKDQHHVTRVGRLPPGRRGRRDEPRGARRRHVRVASRVVRIERNQLLRRLEGGRGRRAGGDPGRPLLADARRVPFGGREQGDARAAWPRPPRDRRERVGRVVHGALVARPRMPGVYGSRTSGRNDVRGVGHATMRRAVARVHTPVATFVRHRLRLPPDETNAKRSP
jgi:hypothetical protein